MQLIRGRWVEVDNNKLSRLLKRFEAMEKAAKTGLPFNEALRLLAGVSLDDSGDPADRDWSQLVAGTWLADILQELRQPEGLAQISPGPELKASLRPYQQAGVRWLYLLTRLGLGACLADDMGL
ncbi:DEAD/DEAH box helicase, partial [Paraburkholderia sp. RL18-085-BIA-A]